MTTADRKLSPAILVAALGVAYGDIGTSTLYAFKESLAGEHGAGVSAEAIYGILSMIFWAVTLIVSIKYMLLVLRADNDGEGGVLALLALVLRHVPAAGRVRSIAIGAGLLGASMFFGESVITPAISVLSAAEGLHVVSPIFTPYVVPLTLVVLVCLFAVQSKGTAIVGRTFGPIMFVWFVVSGALGLWQIVHNPHVLLALDPLCALRFAVSEPAITFVVLGSVFLALTGVEALYADIGHLGARPIRTSWFGLVMPCLVVNYFGQGALVLSDPTAVANPFFLLAPSQLQLPLVILATAAAVIASQAVISGAFSIASQAIKLGFLPRMRIDYTSKTKAGQIYLPLVNFLLLVVVIILVLGFGSSSNLAAAYGLSVATTMVVTSFGVSVIARFKWDWSAVRVIATFGPLIALELLFVAANTAKIPNGGWFPVTFAAGLCLIFTTWKRGRSLVNRQMKQGGIALEPFLKSLSVYPPQRVEGSAVFMTLEPGYVPHALLHNLKHNRVMHERVVFLTAISRTVPHVDPSDMTEIQDLGDGCYAVKVRLGFQDPYDVTFFLGVLARYHDFELVPGETSFFLSRQAVIIGGKSSMAKWRRRLFGWMLRNAQPASDFFSIPPNRAIEIGTQVVI
ncbi:MAG: KUP/HAK/KT family potassium transporter [Burkholderiaceae bacterium]